MLSRLIIIFAFIFSVINLFAQSLDTFKTHSEIEQNYNKFAFVIGKLIAYTPPNDGSKFGNEYIWQWELLTEDDFKIPAEVVNTKIETERYVNKKVLVKAFIKHGIIFGYENTASIAGTKLEIEEISEITNNKIQIDLTKFNEKGLRSNSAGEFTAIHYEFCIPAADSVFNEVAAIDPSITLYKHSKGRSACTDSEWLCIGFSSQPNFIEIISKLAELTYIRKISETFWE